MKRKYFEIYVRIMEGDEVFIVSDGYISIEDEKFRTKEWLESLACNKIYRKDFFIKQKIQI